MGDFGYFTGESNSFVNFFIFNGDLFIGDFKPGDLNPGDFKPGDFNSKFLSIINYSNYFISDDFGNKGVCVFYSKLGIPGDFNSKFYVPDDFGINVCIFKGDYFSFLGDFFSYLGDSYLGDFFSYLGDSYLGDF